MTKLNRKVEYALMALKYMLEQADGSLISAKDVSEALHTPCEATAKILQTLSSAKILQSEKGLQGGYKLIRSLSDVSLHELNEIMEGPSNLVKCAGETPCDIHSTCTIASPLSILDRKVQKFYQSIKLQDLLQTYFESRPHLEVQP